MTWPTIIGPAVVYQTCILYSRKYKEYSDLSFPHFPDAKGQMELHKFAGVSFGITQKPLYITPSNLVR